MQMPLNLFYSAYNPKEYKYAYKDSIRPHMDWSQVKHSKVRTTTLISNDELGELLTVWRKPGGGQLFGSRYKINKVPKKLKKECKFPRSVAVSMRLPALYTDSGVILLDGNHRCTWIYSTQTPFIIILDILYPSTTKPITLEQL